jgi:hypothetical protein
MEEKRAKMGEKGVSVVKTEARSVKQGKEGSRIYLIRSLVEVVSSQLAAVVSVYTRAIGRCSGTHCAAETQKGQIKIHSTFF